MDEGAGGRRLWGPWPCTEWITELNGYESCGTKHGLFGLHLKPQVRKLSPKAPCMFLVEKWQSPSRTGMTPEQACGEDRVSSGTCLTFKPLLLDPQFGFIKILLLCSPCEVWLLKGPLKESGATTSGSSWIPHCSYASLCHRAYPARLECSRTISKASLWLQEARAWYIIGF